MNNSNNNNNNNDNNTNKINKYNSRNDSYSLLLGVFRLQALSHLLIHST